MKTMLAIFHQNSYLVEKKLTQAVFEHIKKERLKKLEKKNSSEISSCDTSDLFEKVHVTVFCDSHKFSWNHFCRDCKMLIWESWLKSSDVHFEHKVESLELTVKKIAK